MLMPSNLHALGFMASARLWQVDELPGTLPARLGVGRCEFWSGSSGAFHFCCACSTVRSGLRGAMHTYIGPELCTCTLNY